MSSPRTQLILLAHGSRDESWRRPFDAFRRNLEAELGRGAVRLAFLQLASPSLAEVAAEAAEQGINELRVLPLFLTGGGHVARDLPPLAEAVRDRHPELTITLLPAAGEHPEVAAALRRIALEAGVSSPDGD